jgi:hypothetical protein
MHLIYRHARDAVYTEATVLTRWQRFYFFSSPSIGYQTTLTTRAQLLSLSVPRGASAVGYGLEFETR